MPVLRYFAAARAAAGMTEEASDAATLGAALERACAGRDDRFRAVLGMCSFLVNGQPVGGRDHATVLLAPADVVDCLPPFAGG